MSAFVTDSAPSPASAMESKGSISSTRRRNCSVVNVPRCDRWKSLCFFLVSAGERNSIGGLHRDSSRAGCQPAAACFSHYRTACKIVGRPPRSAAGPLAGLPVVDETDPVGEERVQGDPRGPGGPPHNFCGILRTGKTSGIRLELKPAPHPRQAANGRYWPYSVAAT